MPRRSGPVSGPLCLTRPSSVSQVRLSPSKLGIAPLELGHDAQGLRVVVEAAAVRHRGVERVLAGMAERRVAEIVRERERLGRSSSSRSARASARAICATSRLWVSRVR